MSRKVVDGRSHIDSVFMAFGGSHLVKNLLSSTRVHPARMPSTLAYPDYNDCIICSPASAVDRDLITYLERLDYYAERLYSSLVFLTAVYLLTYASVYCTYQGATVRYLHTNTLDH